MTNKTVSANNAVSAMFLNDHVGCFGDFSIEDLVCKKFCALRLRCSIETDQNEQIEIMEEMVSYNEMYVKMH
ncbi:MAG: hypothetical protein GY795_46200 [Desulfobacterales bacterium]|nr:hypothetical protein [Desulfobacterales bacterium]